MLTGGTPLSGSGNQMDAPVSGYQVDLGIFQGPLDLLLRLIEKEELDITRIALARVTDQYLAYVARMARRDPAELSAFIVVAVKLLWIKAQALLPQPPRSVPEEEDEGEMLIRQLQEYRRYKEAARQLHVWLEEGRQEFGRLAPPLVPPQPVVIDGATQEALIQALRRRLEELGEQDRALPLPVVRQVTLAEQARRIHALLREQERVPFQALLQAAPTREEVVVTLWAVLELFKRGWVLFEQEELFGPIFLSRRSDTAPEWDQRDAWWAELEELG